MTFWRGVLKVFKRPRKPTAEKSKSENPRRKRSIVGKYGIESTNEMAFKKTVTLRASFRFPAIRFDASTLLSFSGFTHEQAKCPPVYKVYLLLRDAKLLLRDSIYKLNIDTVYLLLTDSVYKLKIHTSF